MKTFTTYAEKKAKQFLNLLQGYTKGIRFTAILILLLMGVSNAWADFQKGSFLYLDISSVTGWTNDGAQIVAIFYYSDNTSWCYETNSAYTPKNNLSNSTSTTKLDDSNMYRVKVPNANVKEMYFIRKDGNTVWNYSAKMTESSGNNCVKLSGWDNSSSWTTYTPNLYVVGNNWGGLPDWSTTDSKGKMTRDGNKYTITLNTDANAHEFKITYYDTWDNAIGHSDNVSCVNGTVANNNGNIKFDPYIAGDVTITYDVSTGKTVITCPAPTITFDMEGGSGGTQTQEAPYGTTTSAITVPTKTGYTFGGYYSGDNGTGTQIIGTDGKWIKSKTNFTDADNKWIVTANKTLYAKWTEKTYSLTFKHDGHGTIKVGGTTVNSGSTASVNHVNTKTLVATPNTGYNFSSWALSGSNTNAVTIGSTSAASTTIKATNTGATVTANFTPKTYTITLNANGGASNGSATATYNSSTITNLTHPTRTDYRCNGYFTAATDGTLVLKTDGTLAKNVSGYTDANGNWIKDGTATLYAQWTYDVTEYTVTFGAGTGFTSYGTVTAKNNTTSAAITSPATVRSGQSVTFTATPESGYEVEGWYTNADCTVGKHDAGKTTYTTSITGNTNVYVKFVEKTWSVAFAASTGGTVTTPSSTPQTVGEVTGINIVANPSAGYSFANWTSSNGGSFGSTTNASTTFKPTAATTVTANFSEIKYTVQVGVAAGHESWGSVSTNSVSVGQHTASGNITATAQTSVGYVFDHWELSDGITITSGDANNATIKIKATKDGSLTAHFRGENRPQEVFLIGTMNGWKTSDTDWQFYKLPGESGNTVTLTKTINKSDYHDAGYKFGINIYHSDWDDKYWKNSSSEDTKMTAHNCTGWKFGTKEGDKKTYIDLSVSGEYTFTLAHSGTYNEQALSITYPDKSFIEGDFATAWDEEAYPLVEDGDIQTVTIPITSKKDVEFRLVSHGKVFGTSTKLLIASNSQTLSKKNMQDDGAVMTIGAYVEGDYTFSYNKSTNVLTVTWPVINQLQVYRANPEHTEATKNWNWDTHNGDVYSKTLSLNANTKYEFKAVLNSDFYGNTTTTLTRETPSVTLNTSGGDVTLQTDIAGDYTFTFNSSNKNLTIAYPTAYKLTYESTYVGGTVSATAQSNTLQLPNTEIVFTATANTGFGFIGWKDGNDNTISTANPYTHKMVSDISIKTDFVTNSEQVVYLKPTSKWKGDKPTFAVHVWNNGGDATAQDIPMTAIDCNGDYYTATIPAGFHSMVFYRKSTDGTTVWNQTADLVIPTDNNNCYTITSTGTKNPFTAAGGNWGTYTEPKYAVTINAPESGTIKVTIGGVTTTVTSEAKTISNVALNAQMTVAFTPATGYELGKAIIQIGNNEKASAAGTYTVCGPTEITAYFVTEEDQVVYLRPTDTWLANNARFVAYAFNRYAGTEAAQWIELTTKDTDYTGAFSGTIPAGFSHVQFVRMPETGDFSFNIDLAQTLNYSIPTDGINNRFILGSQITSGSDEGKYQGSWEASNTPIWSIPGDWTGDKQWTAENATPLYGSNGNATLALQASITTEFKLYQFPYGTQERQWYGNSETLVRGNSADKEFTTDTDNCKLTTDIAGDYVFSFNIRNKRLTVTYPELPVPNAITVASRRLYDNTELDWFEGNGTEANPYKLYNDETIRLTVSPLTEVAGLTAYYKMGDNEEQTSNVFDWEETMSEPTKTTIQAYYKNATGTSTETVSVETPYYIQISLPFYLMTEPSGEININRVAAGENILVQFRSDAAATVGLYVKIGNGEEQKLTDITSTISTDYTHDVDDNIAPCVLHYIARSTAPVHDRIFEATTDVAIYKNVIIKVNDPEGWVKNAYMWRDYSDAVLTQWPGDPVLQNFGTWRVFSVKYPYYDRFIVNDGKAEGATQTIDYVLPADDTCYELLDPADNGSSDPADTGKYGLQVADCPGNLIVSDIKDTTIMEGEQIVVMPEIFVGLGYKLSDVRITQLNANYPSSVRADISGTNIIIWGYGIGESNVDVTYTLGNETITKTFKVYVVKNTNITIQVKVPDFGDGTNYQWKDGTKIGIRYWGAGIDGTDLIMDYAYTDGTYMYAQAQIPLGTDGTIHFHFYYEKYGDDNAKWRQTTNISATNSGCYTLKQGNDYYRHSERTADYCFNDENYAQYQVKVFMPTLGKVYSSNIVTNTTDILSFFAPGENETGYRAGNVQLYKNKKMIASIPANNFPESNVYTATIAETGDGLDNVSTYSGNFYIRTWGTSYATVGFNNGKGWNSIKDLTAVEKDSVRFTKFASREGEFYNHYWVQDMNTGTFDGKDVSACVANEYNDDLAGKLLQDKHTNEYGDIKVGTGKVINVRFGYDPRTNYFGRAILQGSENDTYLNIHCDNAYYDKDCTKKFPYGTSNRDNKMYDISTWVYQRDFYVPITNTVPSATLYVEATSPSTERTVTDHLLGYVTNEITGEATSTPIQKTVIGSGTTNGTYLIRVIYDFKTNRIITAWLPQGTVEVNSEKKLNADVLFVRKENEEVPQIQLSSTGKIKSLESMFFAMELQRGDADRNNRHQEQYWFTLPFDCVVGSISGVPGYMQIWGIQRYNGKKRAENGWFNPSTTFWEWLTPDDVMHAGEGYLLVFDKKNAPFEEIEVDKMDAEGNIIDGQKEIISMMRLYFPSIKSGFDMQQQSEEHLKRTYENHTCTITTANRYLQDSNWKVIGTTSYNNAGITGYTKDDNPKYDELSEAPSFRYQYEYTMSNDNTSFWYKYTPENGKTATYKSFYGYMVQFAGTINWQPIMSETVPEQIAARRYVPANERTSYTTRLELANAAGEVQDLTFVALDEKATIGFDQNKDLNKVKNRGTNIYTFVEGLPFAGNTLPMEKATVPVGVRVDAAGEYTFRMPDGTDGIAVTLVDNVTGTHTNMLMNEYTVTLNAGTIENRFYLVVDPDRTATSVENVGEEAKGEEAKGVEKFLIDGKLFIRTTDGIFDAKGQRL